MFKSAKWICAPQDCALPVVAFFTSVIPQKGLKKALLHVSSMGVYALFINGIRTGKGILTPGWTSCDKRVQYQTYSLDSLKSGEPTEISIGVAPGWAVGCLGIDRKQVFAEHTAAIAELELYYDNGLLERIGTDRHWQVRTTPVQFSELYHGETVDLTAPIQTLGNACECSFSVALIPQEGEWITEQEHLAPVEIIRTPRGETVIDFGQNLSGYVELHIKANRGDTVLLHHAEVLDKDGNFYNANYRSARNENRYICSGDADVFKPTYSFQGFRYIRLTEYPLAEVDPNSFRAVAISSELHRTSYFVCGNEKINQLYHNILWGQKSNYIDVPTDCPQRDERLGWTGDAQFFCRAAMLNFDIERFLCKWLRDMALDQMPNGSIPSVIPNVFPHLHSTAGWGDACYIIPWQLYMTYGNKTVLTENFEMMKKWVDFIRSSGGGDYLWLDGDHCGDWLAMDDGPDRFAGATPKDLIATAFYAHSTELLICAGECLQKDMSDYRMLLQKIRHAFHERYLPNGVLVPVKGKNDTLGVKETQTAYVLILYFRLFESEEERHRFSARLCEMIRENGTRMSTGMVGTPYLLHVLSDNGATDLAYELLLQEKNPSWLYSVCHGATTMWEHWNSIKEDGSFWSDEMNSFNHYVYGAVLDWIFRVPGGICATSAGYKTLSIVPHPIRAFGFADFRYETRWGSVRVHWYYKQDKVFYEFEIPAGVTADLTLPNGHCEQLTCGVYHFATPAIE